MLAGTAHFHVRRGVVTTSFTYAPTYLADRRGFALDPALVLDGGSHHVTGLPASFADAAPDRWGRTLIGKRIRSVAREDGAASPMVTETDYLLGVSDLSRQGALRFRTSADDTFLSADRDVPKLIELPRLLNAASLVSGDQGDDLAAVKDLLDAGSGSLGGARPKASVRGDGGQLLIAKFPHADDAWNVAAWEMTALDLADRAGVAVPERRLAEVGPATVLLVDRFDRTGDGRRLPYISALSLVGGVDGDDFDYADVTAAIEEHGRARDLPDLFRRVVVSVALHNTDDHLRNLGCLRAAGGWGLAPSFDVNPNPDPARGRRTTIGGAERPADEPDGLLAFAGDCHLGTDDARRIIGEVLSVMARWRDVARSHRVPEREIVRFEESFEQQRRLLAAVV